jgi:hypothetical protein
VEPQPPRSYSYEILLKVPQKGYKLPAPLSPDSEEQMLRWAQLWTLLATLASLAAFAGLGKVW